MTNKDKKVVEPKMKSLHDHTNITVVLCMIIAKDDGACHRCHVVGHWPSHLLLFFKIQRSRSIHVN